ncbi:hypothetical protein GGF31_008169 [Allomyces arbusculus]|nr:hypothetical protein GGF31_008169 [Allomyces arbusculus]
MAIKARKMAAKARKLPVRALKIVAKAPPPPLKHGVIMDERGHRVLRGHAKKDDVPKSVRDSLQLGTYLETDDGHIYQLGLSKSNANSSVPGSPVVGITAGSRDARTAMDGILKLACIICNPCKHKKRLRACLLCKLEGIPGGGANLCDSHGKQSYSCKRCTRDLHALGYATLYCFHLAKRDDCGPCKGRRICSTPDCFLRALGIGCDLCLACFVIANPEHTLTVKWRLKELAVVEYFKRVCPRLSFLCNKQVPNGSSNRRPDMFFDLGSFALIVDVDENQHRGCSYVDEHARILDLYGDIKRRPLVVVRINPDRYFDANGSRV